MAGGFHLLLILKNFKTCQMTTEQLIRANEIRDRRAAIDMNLQELKLYVPAEAENGLFSYHTNRTTSIMLTKDQTWEIQKLMINMLEAENELLKTEFESL